MALPRLACQTSCPLAVETASKLPPAVPNSTSSDATAGEESTALPAWKAWLQTGAAVWMSTAVTEPLSSPMYATPSKTAGEVRTAAPDGKFHAAFRYDWLLPATWLFQVGSFGSKA